jgi:tetratricopeptide (TPR) repeat protein
MRAILALSFVFIVDAVAVAQSSAPADKGAPPHEQQSESPPKSGPPASPPDRPAPPAGRQAPGGAPAQKNAQKGPPPIAVQQPRTPAEREKALSDLYALLATAADEAAAKTVAASIERLWLNSGSDTVGVLMERAGRALQGKDPAKALTFLDAVVDLAPDFTEGWHRRAKVLYSQNNVERALGDLRRVLALDPNHFEALEAVAHILKEIDQKRGALAAVRKLLEVHPFADGAKTLHDELSRAVEGQAL